jgi:hypothetical protein
LVDEDQEVGRDGRGTELAEKRGDLSTVVRRVIHHVLQHLR